MSDGRDLSHLLEPVARRFCGDPSPLSTADVLRFGPTGAIWVDLDTKTWGDTEDDTAGGSTIEFVAYRTGLVNGGCEGWLSDHGFSLDKPPNVIESVKNGHDSRNVQNGELSEQRPSALVSVELEQALLGAVLMDPGSIHSLTAVLPEHFSEPIHRRIFDTMRSMAEAGRLASPVTIAPYLPADMKIGEMNAQAYVAALAAASTGTAAADLAKGIIDLGQLRRLQTIGYEMVENAGARDAGAPPRAQIDAAVTKLTALSSQGLRPTQRASTVGSSAKETIADLDSTAPRQRPTSTGLHSLDRIIGGYRRGALDILAGRPGMGKSMMAASSGLMLARQGHGVIYFSMEMTKPQLTARLLTDQAFRHTEPVLYSSILDNAVTRDDHRQLLKQAANEVADLPYIIEPQPGLSIAEIGVRASRYIESMMKRGIPTPVVIIDHLGKVRRPGKANENVELGQVTARAAELAKEFDTCFLVLCQLNRGVESRDDNKPRLGDLRESGHIEEDADAVLMLYREAYYLGKQSHTDPEKEDARRERFFRAFSEMDIFITKNRHGAEGHAQVWTHPGAAIVRDKEQRDFF